MFAKVFTASISGYEALPVTVEADKTFGLPSFDLVGLPDASVSESRQRIRMVLNNSGCKPVDGSVAVKLLVWIMSGCV